MCVVVESVCLCVFKPKYPPSGSVAEFVQPQSNRQKEGVGVGWLGQVWPQVKQHFNALTETNNNFIFNILQKVKILLVLFIKLLFVWLWSLVLIQKQTNTKVGVV